MALPSRPSSWTTELAIVLVYTLAIAAIPSTATAWDGIGFLLGAQPPIQVNYGHALYTPALCALDTVLCGVLGSGERAAKLFSALGAALAFWLLWRRALRAAIPLWLAAGAAALFATTPLFLRESGVVEPSTWTIASLLLAAAAAERYGHERTLARLALLVGATLLAFGFHLVSACALPWLTLLALRPAPRPPAWHALVPVGTAAVVLALGTPRLPGFWAHWMSFVPTYQEGFGFVLADHARRGCALVGGGAPLLSACALLGAAWLWRVHRLALLAPLALIAPYLTAFLLLGRPLVALLLPVTLALALVVCSLAAQAATRAAVSRVLRIGLPLALVLQIAGAIPHVREWTRAENPDRARALFFARTLPKAAILFAGPSANHVRYHTDVPVVALPNLLQSALAADRDVDPIDVVHDEAERQAERGLAPYLTGEAFLYLHQVWSADPLRLGLDERLFVSGGDDLTFSLVPIAVGHAADEGDGAERGRNR